jgi:catechol 2,3-dioxygenase-like lactoylglutathione lyase family enzyme
MSTDAAVEGAEPAAPEDDLELRLEVVVVPVSDVDRAKSFYTEKLGFNADVDRQVSEEMRVVQLTPPGSACSVTIGEGLGSMEPGSMKGLQLVVSDIRKAREVLAGRGLDITEVQVFDEGTRRPVQEGDELDFAGFAFFDDPDGNSWAIQQMPAGR